MPTRMNSHGRPEIRRGEAEARAAARAERSHQDQLALLDKRFGKGKGAERERTRLASLIEKEGQTKKKGKKEAS